ncbi:hypothetical protein VYU27_005693 [Nannochloropsis oceanica]
MSEDLTPEMVQKMKVAELKAELTKRDLDSSGLKADLVTRLNEHIVSAGVAGEGANAAPAEPQTQEIDEPLQGEKRKEPEAAPVDDAVEAAADDASNEQCKKARVEENENGSAAAPTDPAPAPAPTSTSRWNAEETVTTAPAEDQQQHHVSSAEYVVDTQPVVAAPKIKKTKGAEVYVGNLDPYTTEEDLRALFSQLGEVTEIRLKMRQQMGGRNFGFVRFSDKDAAARAVSELDRRLELHGRTLTISFTAVNDKLRFTNLPIHWRADQIEAALESQGCEGVYEMELPLEADGVSNQGFCVVEFDNHPAAQRAYRITTTPSTGVVMDGKRLTVDWPDGVDRSTQQQAQQRMGLGGQLDGDMQVKNIYVGGVPVDVTEAEMRSVFEAFGEIDNVRLAGQAPNARRPDFAFVNYRDRESAIRALESLRVEPRAQIRGHALDVEMAKPPKSQMMMQQQQRAAYGAAQGYSQGYQQAYAQGTGYTAGGSYYQQTSGGAWQQQPTEAAYGAYGQQAAVTGQGVWQQQGYGTAGVGGVQQSYGTYGGQQGQQQQWGVGGQQQQGWDQGGTGAGGQSYGRY